MSVIYTTDGHEFVPVTALPNHMVCRGCGSGGPLTSVLGWNGPPCPTPWAGYPSPTTPATVPAPAGYRPPVSPPRPTCGDCDRELSTYLDAYTGRDPILKDLCRDCRAERERVAKALGTT